jgi:hypothetical protein
MLTAFRESHVRALILYTPPTGGLRDKASQLSKELHWRGFDPEVEAGDPAAGHDVADYRLLVVVFPVFRIPRFPLAGGDVRTLIDGLRGLDGVNVALLAVTVGDPSCRLHGLRDAIERQGGDFITFGATSMRRFGEKGLRDLAAECMGRIPS